MILAQLKSVFFDVIYYKLICLSYELFLLQSVVSYILNFYTDKKDFSNNYSTVEFYDYYQILTITKSLL